MDTSLDAICSLIQEHFILHPDPERESKVCVTVAAFYILHKRAATYAKLPEASLAEIQQRLITLFETEAMLIAPDCPELESDPNNTVLVLFQKINRYLFQELDNILEQYLKTEMPDVSKLSLLLTLQNNILLPLPSLSIFASNAAELPVPPIEWAVNILEEFDYTIYSNLKPPPPLCNWIKTIIDKHYDPTSLVSYLQLGWNAILARYSEVIIVPSGTLNRAKLLHTFVDRLRNTMCYPARVSILSTSLTE
jgi:hypothetical protein